MRHPRFVVPAILSALLTALLTASGLLAQPGPDPAPLTRAELAALALTPDEVNAVSTIEDAVVAPPSPDRFAAVTRLYRRTNPDETVLLVLAPASLGTPAGLAETILTGLSLTGERPERVTPTPSETTALGGDLARFTLGEEAGTLYAWQQSGVVAILAGHGLENVAVLQLASRQQTRLTERLGRGTATTSGNDRADPVVQSACPAAQPIRGARLPDGTPVYYVPGDRLYSEVVPEACYRTETIALNAGYRRAAT